MNNWAGLPARALNLSIKHLRALRMVATYGSFTAAASALAMTQPGVSRLVRQVERDLGIALFLRSTRHVALTAAGSSFIEPVGRFLDDLDTQVALARSRGGPLRGRLVISSLLSLTHHMVPDALLTYREENPEVEIHLREGLGADVYEDVRNGVADFGLGNAMALSDEIVVESMIEEACMALLPAGHVLARARNVPFTAFEGKPLVSLPLASGLRRLIDGVAGTHGVTLNHMIVVEQFSSMFDFVAAGFGLAIVPPSALPKRLRPGLVIRPITDSAVVRSIGILRLRNRALTPAADAFLRVLRPYFVRRRVRLSSAVGTK